eukprot:COSAG06_NODE_88_length_24864_cov_7.159368_2_plen_69_part_00
MSAVLVSVSPPPPPYPVDEEGFSIVTVGAAADHTIVLELDEAQLYVGTAQVAFHHTSSPQRIWYVSVD